MHAQSYTQRIIYIHGLLFCSSFLQPLEVFLIWKTVTIFTFQVWNEVSPGTDENELDIF